MSQEADVYIIKDNNWAQLRNVILRLSERLDKIETANAAVQDSVDFLTEASSNTFNSGLISPGGLPGILSDEVILADNAEYLVGAAHPELTSERVVTDTDTITWDLTVSTQAQANITQLDTGWAVSNLTPDKVLDADITSIDELADILGTLISLLLTKGILGA